MSDFLYKLPDEMVFGSWLIENLASSDNPYYTLIKQG